MGDYDFYQEAATELEQLGISIYSNVIEIENDKNTQMAEKGEALPTAVRTSLYALKLGAEKFKNATINYNTVVEEFLEAPLDSWKRGKFQNANKKTEENTPIADSLDLADDIRAFLKVNKFYDVKEEKGKKLYQSIFSLENARSFQILHNALNERFDYIERKNSLSKIMEQKECAVESASRGDEAGIERTYRNVKDYSNLSDQMKKKKEKIHDIEKSIMTLKEDLTEERKQNRLRKIAEEIRNLETLEEKSATRQRNLKSDLREMEEALMEKKNMQKSVLKSMEDASEEKKRLEEEEPSSLKQLEDLRKKMAEAVKSYAAAKSDEAVAGDGKEIDNVSVMAMDASVKGFAIHIKQLENQIEENQKTIRLNVSLLENLNKEKQRIEKDIKEREEKQKPIQEELRQMDENIKKAQTKQNELRNKYSSDDMEYSNSVREKIKEKENEKKQLEEELKSLEEARSCKEVYTGKYMTEYKNLKEVVAERRALKEPDYRDYSSKMYKSIQAACGKFLQYQSIDAAKDSNSGAYTAMLNSLAAAKDIKQEQVMDLLNDIRQKAEAYKAAKAKQWRPFPSALRLTRLAMADGLITYCDQMVKQYGILREIKKPAAITKEEADIMKKAEQMLHQKGNLTREHAEAEVESSMNKKAEYLRTAPVDDDFVIPEDVEEMEISTSKKQILGV